MYERKKESVREGMKESKRLVTYACCFEVIPGTIFGIEVKTLVAAGAVIGVAAV